MYYKLTFGHWTRFESEEDPTLTLTDEPVAVVPADVRQDVCVYTLDSEHRLTCEKINHLEWVLARYEEAPADKLRIFNVAYCAAVNARERYLPDCGKVDFEEAAGLYMLSAEFYEKEGDAEQCARMRYNAGMCLLNLGRMDEAIVQMQKMQDATGDRHGMFQIAIHDTDRSLWDDFVAEDYYEVHIHRAFKCVHDYLTGGYPPKWPQWTPEVEAKLREMLYGEYYYEAAAALALLTYWREHRRIDWELMAIIEEGSKKDNIYCCIVYGQLCRHLAEKYRKEAGTYLWQAANHVMEEGLSEYLAYLRSFGTNPEKYDKYMGMAQLFTARPNYKL